MELKFILAKLKEQESALRFANLDIWFPTTYQYIEDHFHSYSSRARTFDDLIQEYFILEKIFHKFGIHKKINFLHKSKT